ncbi:MAG: hypothetical protein PHN75_11350 [Syntrophales bacterium]|nr:hypothetical protein [Syntrophales bacterium]
MEETGIMMGVAARRLSRWEVHFREANHETDEVAAGDPEKYCIITQRKLR